MKGVVLAAGYGNRLLPFTSFRPKHLLPVAGKPILHRSLEYMRDVLDITDIIIVVGYQMKSIMDYFKNGQEIGMDVSYVVQHAGHARGLAAATGLVQDQISNDFVLFLGDNLFGANLKHVIDLHNASNASATLHVEEHSNPQRFGVVELDGDNVISVEEKPENPKSNNVITGFYVLSPTIFNMISGLQPSARGEYELSDALQSMINQHYTVKASKIDGWRLDIGYPEDLLAVNKLLLNDETHTVKGDVENSTILPPVYIAEGSKIKDSVIGPYVMIEKGVSIDRCEVKNSVVLEKSKLYRSVISNSVVGSNSVVKGLKAHSLKVGDYSDISNGTL
ncbi:MAG: sugar phosphate nucleotidyltransferase [Candidatus Heimdallarchaeaceae archaeon]